MITLSIENIEKWIYGLSIEATHNECDHTEIPVADSELYMKFINAKTEQEWLDVFPHVLARFEIYQLPTQKTRFINAFKNFFKQNNWQVDFNMLGIVAHYEIYQFATEYQKTNKLNFEEVEASVNDTIRRLVS